MADGIDPSLPAAALLVKLREHAVFDLIVDGQAFIVLGGDVDATGIVANAANIKKLTEPRYVDADAQAENLETVIAESDGGAINVAIPAGAGDFNITVLRWGAELVTITGMAETHIIDIDLTGLRIIRKGGKIILIPIQFTTA